ncbi:DUF2513 domain-containing protein [Cyclobacterium plantarum]|uniref:DUF2513 domain-containing protein n=1 Tax=Cyclobacterium plantarum TaxID=2716263 RepID=A0ABX0H997_9BACT|nr:DUF2513 domain-containing protein [Cyclobacterium plantarum]NHE57940.1 DUF2513 domain-containing protein [Cyclobacterium plantarum]
MKRDLELIKKILLELEKDQSPFDWKSFEYADKISYCYHIKLLWQADLIEAIDMSSKGNPDWAPICLTWQGHEFLEAAKNDKAWDKVKSTTISEGVSMPFSVLKELLLITIKTELGF